MPNSIDRGHDDDEPVHYDRKTQSIRDRYGNPLELRGDLGGEPRSAPPPVLLPIGTMDRLVLAPPKVRARLFGALMRRPRLMRLFARLLPLRVTLWLFA